MSNTCSPDGQQRETQSREFLCNSLLLFYLIVEILNINTCVRVWMDVWFGLFWFSLVL